MPNYSRASRGSVWKNGLSGGRISIVTKFFSFHSLQFTRGLRQFTGGEQGSTGSLEAGVACRGWSVGHDKSRPNLLNAESNLVLAA